MFKVGWDFERTGQLGDSFGVVGALMASLAAYFTFQALTDEKAETAKLRNREMKRDQSDKRNQAETTLFRMFDMRTIILEGIHTKSGREIFTGRASIEEIYKRFISPDLGVLYGEEKSPPGIILQQHIPSIGHYLRFTYHIIKFICDNFEKNDQYQYARLLRAQLSNSEQVIIAVNCAHGEGRGQFHDWIEDFSLLHNIDEKDRKQFEMEKHFSANAFNSPINNKIGDM